MGTLDMPPSTGEAARARLHFARAASMDDPEAGGVPLDTSGDGRPDAIGFDTTGDGQPDVHRRHPAAPTTNEESAAAAAGEDALQAEEAAAEASLEADALAEAVEERRIEAERAARELQVAEKRSGRPGHSIA